MNLVYSKAIHVNGKAHVLGKVDDPRSSSTVRKFKYCNRAIATRRRVQRNHFEFHLRLVHRMLHWRCMLVYISGPICGCIYRPVCECRAYMAYMSLDVATGLLQCQLFAN